NGNITFTGPLDTFTPFGLQGAGQVIIAPFFADVDTSVAGTGGSMVVTYGTSTINGRPSFGVNYVNVGYFDSNTNKLNSFQVVLLDRGDTGAGNFDIEFNYDKITWETGDASGGTNGLGGSSAVVGYSNGSNLTFQLNGSLVPGSFLDGGPVSLSALSQNSNVR